MEASSERVSAPVFEVSHTLEVEHFDALIRTLPKGQYIDSRDFGHSETPEIRWEITVYPNGKDEESLGQVSVFLHPVRIPDGAELRVNCTLSVMDKSFSFAVEDKVFKRVGSGFGEDIVAHEDLQLGPRGLLRVSAKLEYAWGAPVGALTPKPCPLDVSGLLCSKRYADFTLRLGEAAFPVHRAVLASRSPVFAAMFAQSSTSEALTSEAVIEETSRPALLAMLRFAYTGRLEGPKEETTGGSGTGSGAEEGGLGLGLEEVCGVLGLAERYQMAGLKGLAEAEAEERATVADLPLLAPLAALHDSQRLSRVCHRLLQAHPDQALQQHFL